MAPATIETVWRRTVKKQLERSGIPTRNEAAYRPYASILCRLAQESGINLEDLDYSFFTLVVKTVGQDSFYDWEADLLIYVAQLLCDYQSGELTPPIQGLRMSCYSCGSACVYEDGKYVCTCCDAFARASENQLPLGLPVGRDIRFQRAKLHEALDPIWKQGIKPRSWCYSWIASKLELATELTHIGMVTTMEEVILWHSLIAELKATLVKEHHYA